MENKPPIEEVTEEDIKNSSSADNIELHVSSKKQHSPLASLADKIKDYTVNSIILSYQLINDMPRLMMCLSPRNKYILFKRALTYSILHDIYFAIVTYTPIKKYKEVLPLLPITIYSSLLTTIILLIFTIYFKLHKEESLSFKYNYDGEYNEELYDDDGYLIVSKDKTNNIQTTPRNNLEGSTSKGSVQSKDKDRKIQSKTNILDIDNIIQDNVSHETLNNSKINNDNFKLAPVAKVVINDELKVVLSNPSKLSKELDD